ncbi:hypothetical protein BDW69DRAFT_183704 [Aspergillus filifer]
MEEVCTRNNPSPAIGKNILYLAFFDLAGRTRLRVDYGPIRGAQDQWRSEEYSVTSPKLCEFLSEFSRNILRHPLVRTPSLGQENSNYIQDEERDCLPEISHEILEMLALYLPAESMASLRKASGSFNLAARDPSFWRNQMRQRTPWAWELWNILEKTGLRTVNLRCFMACLTGKFPKRIWEVCERIREIYIKYTRLLPHPYTEVEYQVILQDLREQRARELRFDEAPVPLPEGAAWE